MIENTFPGMFLKGKPIGNLERCVLVTVHAEERALVFWLCYNFLFVCLVERLFTILSVSHAPFKVLSLKKKNVSGVLFLAFFFPS